MLENHLRDITLILVELISVLIGYMLSILMHVVFISSPYLLVFGDDRVRGTRE